MCGWASELGHTRAKLHDNIKRSSPMLSHCGGIVELDELGILREQFLERENERNEREREMGAEVTS